jgi:hypothetical protein
VNSVLRCTCHKPLVNVHVVAAGNSCQAVARVPTMSAHEQRTPPIPRDLGVHASGGASLHPRPRSQSRGVGSDGAAVAGAAAAGLAHLVAPPVERSASGLGEAAMARVHWTSAWGATRAQGTRARLGAHRLNQSIRDWHSWAHRDAAPIRASGNGCVPMSCGSI